MNRPESSKSHERRPLETIARWLGRAAAHAGHAMVKSGYILTGNEAVHAYYERAEYRDDPRDGPPLRELPTSPADDRDLLTLYRRDAGIEVVLVSFATEAQHEPPTDGTP